MQTKAHSPNGLQCNNKTINIIKVKEGITEHT